MKIHTVWIGAALMFVSATAFAQSGLTVDWQWKRSDRCATVSPALTVAGIPIGTKTLQVKLTDQDVPSYNHGGGTIDHDGSPTASLPAGALKSAYQGPCPPNFMSFGHEYVVNVRALADDGKTELASGSKTKNFSAKSVPE